MDDVSPIVIQCRDVAVNTHYQRLNDGSVERLDVLLKVLHVHREAVVPLGLDDRLHHLFDSHFILVGLPSLQQPPEVVLDFGRWICSRYRAVADKDAALDRRSQFLDQIAQQRAPDD